MKVVFVTLNVIHTQVCTVWRFVGETAKVGQGVKKWGVRK